MDEAKETFGFPIEIDLTAEELEAMRARELEITRERFVVEGEKAVASSQFSERLKTLKKEQLALIAAIDAKQTKRDVECYQERDERRGMMLTMRCDNGHIVDERALTAEERGAAADERQGNLFETTGADVAAGGDDEEEGPSDPDLENVLDEYNRSLENGTLEN